MSDTVSARTELEMNLNLSCEKYDFVWYEGFKMFERFQNFSSNFALNAYHSNNIDIVFIFLFCLFVKWICFFFYLSGEGRHRLSLKSVAELCLKDIIGIWND